MSPLNKARAKPLKSSSRSLNEGAAIIPQSGWPSPMKGAKPEGSHVQELQQSHIEPAMPTARKRPSLCPGRRPRPNKQCAIEPACDRLPASQFIQFRMSEANPGTLQSILAIDHALHFISRYLPGIAGQLGRATLRDELKEFPALIWDK